MLTFERHSMSCHKRLTVILIPLLLASTFAAASHFHADAAERHECPVCVVSHHQPATGQTAVTFETIPCFTETTFVASAHLFIDNPFFISRSNRAPPA